MCIIEGDRSRDKLTGQSFAVKKIIDGVIILEAEDTPKRFSLSSAVVELFFDRSENENRIH